MFRHGVKKGETKGDDIEDVIKARAFAHNKGFKRLKLKNDMHINKH